MADKQIIKQKEAENLYEDQAAAVAQESRNGRIVRTSIVGICDGYGFFRE